MNYGHFASRAPLLFVITGPESTGKSVMAKKLSEQLEVPFSPEYARHFLENLNRPYVLEDLLNIAKGQARWIDELVEKGRKDGVPFVLADTDLLTIYLWSIIKYGKVAPWVKSKLYEQRPDHYLLMRPDVPWVPDPLRESPNARNEIFKVYLKEIQSMGVPYTIISGAYEKRIKACKEAIERQVAARE